MQCEKCKIKRATVFFTELDRTRHALCGFCAAERNSGSTIPNDEGAGYAPVSYLYELVHSDNGMYCHNGERNADMLCPTCKTSLDDALNSGRMGCPSCYTSFLHVAQFTGYANQSYSKYNEKMPRRYKERLDTEKRIIKLGALLSEAISLQNFEEAAKIRDEIKILENMKKGA